MTEQQIEELYHLKDEAKNLVKTLDEQFKNVFDSHNQDELDVEKIRERIGMVEIECIIARKALPVSDELKEWMKKE